MLVSRLVARRRLLHSCRHGSSVCVEKLKQQEDEADDEDGHASIQQPVYFNVDQLTSSGKAPIQVCLSKCPKADLPKNNDASVTPDIATYLRRFGNEGQIAAGKRLHAVMVKSGCGRNLFLGNLLVQMYGKCGATGASRAVFDRLRGKNVYSWTIMVAMYAQNGLLKEALQLFQQIEERNVVSWNSMIAGYAQHGHCKEAINFFWKMQLGDVLPNKVTFVGVLDACMNVGGYADGKIMHSCIVHKGFESDLQVATALVNMYGNCGTISLAEETFDRIIKLDSICWNALIGLYAQQDLFNHAIICLNEMQSQGMVPDGGTFVNVLDALSSPAAFADGKRVHTYILSSRLDSDVVVGTALINMYGKCGRPEDAQETFDRMPVQNVVSWNTMLVMYAKQGLVNEAIQVFKSMPEKSAATWNAMIVVYSQQGCFVKSLQVFRQMQLENVVPNKATFVSILDSCAGLAALSEGKRLHKLIVKNGFEDDIIVGNALVNMYGKCGSMDDAQITFNKMPKRNVVSWAAMIAAYAQHGHGEETLELLKRMLSDSVMPHNISFVSLLSACSHAGLVNDASHMFLGMPMDYGVTPTVEHYNSMNDLLGRAGLLKAAEDLMIGMPFESTVLSWMGLLGACRQHVDVNIGRHAAAQAFAFDNTNAAPYVLLSNIFSEAGMWDDAVKARMLIKSKGLKIQGGRSSIIIKDKVHEFSVGDDMHPLKDEIYEKLQKLNREIKEAGMLDKVLDHDLEGGEENDLPFYHSEKLAIGLGLISTSPGTTIRIVKNLRICPDCHPTIKLISKVTRREIVVRDTNRFHNFKDGVCSCADYW